MNTYRIYEDLKATLGDAAAKSLAQTLGTMFEELRDTVTKEDFRMLRESIDANVSRLDATMMRLAEGQVKLVEAQTHTDMKMAWGSVRHSSTSSDTTVISRLPDRDGARYGSSSAS